MILKIFLTSFIFASLAHAQVPAGVYRELQKYTVKNIGGLSQTYIDSFPEKVENLFNKAPKNQTCTDKTTVTFGIELTTEATPAIAEFESGLIKIDATFCFPAVRPDLILKISNDPAFRAQAFSTIQKSYSKDRLLCETTSAPTIGTSNYCYQLTSYQEPGYATTQSYNVWNDSDLSYNSPVYFRSIFESARQTDQYTIYHVISLIRANNLNSVQKFFAKSYILTTQEKVMQKLKEELR